MLNGGVPYPDHLSRRERLKAAHPQVRIAFVGPAWQAVIPLPDGEDVITRYELGDVLDVLEERLMNTT